MSKLSMVMTGRLKAVLRGAGIILVVSFWGGYLWHNWGSFETYRWQLDSFWLVLSCLVAAVYWAMLPLIWYRVLIAVGGSLSRGSAFRIWVTSMLARYVPGGVWHIAGRVYLAEKGGQSGSAVFVSTVMEQILCLLGTLLLLFVSLPFWDADYTRLMPTLILTLPLAIGVHPAVLRRFMSLAANFANRRNPPKPISSRFDGQLKTKSRDNGGREAKEGLPYVAEQPELLNGKPLEGGPLPTPGYGALLGFLGLYVLPNLLAVLSLYLSAAAVEPVTLSQLPAFAGAYAIGWFVGYFSFFAPSGLGVREGAVALFLTPVVGAPVAVAASALSRIALSLGEAVVVGACWAVAISRQRLADSYSRLPR